MSTGSYMMRWSQHTLGDVLTLHRGYDLPERDRRPGHVPIVSSSGVTGYHDVVRVKGPGVVTGRYGTLGEVFYVEVDYWPLNTTLFVSDFKGNDPRFISYFLRTLNFGNQNAAGAVPGVNRNHLHLLPVCIPTLPIQRKIAAILSAYDDLIENNTRSIAILEAMAQALYREWFVHFRFPGHESIPLVDSPLGQIPQGWEVKALGEITDAAGGTVRTGPFGSQLHESDYTLDGVPVVMPKNILGGRVVTDDIARIPEEEAERLSQHRLRRGDIVYGRRGDIGRRALIGTRQDGWLCGTGCLRISLGENQLLSPTVLYLYLGLDDVVKSIANRAVGATLPNLNTSILCDTLVLRPPWPMQEKAATAIEGFLETVDILLDQNTNLRRTRDLLLPKLVSGEVDVSGMEIVVGE